MDTETAIRIPASALVTRLRWAHNRRGVWRVEMSVRQRKRENMEHERLSQPRPHSITLTLSLPPSPRLIKLNLLTTDQRLLQSDANTYRVDRALQLHRQWPVVETAGRELVGLGDKGLAEPAVVVRWDLAPDAAGFVDVDQVGRWLRVDGEFAGRAGDFGGYGSENEMCQMGS